MAYKLYCIQLGLPQKCAAVDDFYIRSTQLTESDITYMHCLVKKNADDYGTEDDYDKVVALKLTDVEW